MGKVVPFSRVGRTARLSDEVMEAMAELHYADEHIMKAYAYHKSATRRLMALGGIASDGTDGAA